MEEGPKREIFGIFSKKTAQEPVYMKKTEY